MLILGFRRRFPGVRRRCGRGRADRWCVERLFELERGSAVAW